MSVQRKPISKGEISELPLLAIVALASRCARRAMPLFLAGNESLEKLQEVQVVLRAIRYAEEIANGGTATGECGTPAVELGLASSGSASCAAFIAGCAAHAADWATGEGIFPEAADKTVFFAADAVLGFQLNTIPYLTQNGAVVEYDHSIDDFQTLLRLNLGNFPERGGPIDTSEEGPLGLLWMKGTPSWYEEGIAELIGN